MMIRPQKPHEEPCVRALEPGPDRLRKRDAAFVAVVVVFIALFVALMYLLYPILPPV